MGVVDGFPPKGIEDEGEGGSVSKNFPKTGKKTCPKTAVKSKRFLCAKCCKRSPKPAKTPAPWYCPACRRENEKASGISRPAKEPR
jgi:hypothetical protein